MAKTKIRKILLLSLAFLVSILPLYLLTPYFILISNFIKPNYSFLSENSDGIVSILILGKGGVGHTAPDLTDAIVNVVINPKTKKITTFSIPRDIWIPDIRAKINSSYYWDKQKSNQDYELTKSSVLEVTGIYPDYIVVVDFSLFLDLVEDLGGVEIFVENSFVDERYPISGKENDDCGFDKTYSCRYETLRFTQGRQLMDGETALKFVRSRNSEGLEGTDLAREKRQQKVIEAIKNKILSKDVLLNPVKLYKIYNTAISNIETNIDKKTVIKLAGVFLEFKNNMENISFPEELIKFVTNNPRYDYQYVIIPKQDNWGEFQRWLFFSI